MLEEERNMMLHNKQAYKVEAAAMPRKQENSGFSFAWPFTHYIFKDTHTYTVFDKKKYIHPQSCLFWTAGSVLPAVCGPCQSSKQVIFWSNGKFSESNTIQFGVSFSFRWGTQHKNSNPTSLWKEKLAIVDRLAFRGLAEFLAQGCGVCAKPRCVQLFNSTAALCWEGWRKPKESTAVSLRMMWLAHQALGLLCGGTQFISTIL